jgi:hypothetical protein
MSSVVRSYASLNKGITRFLKPESPSYNDTVEGQDVLFPFSYLNGVLDISYDGNNFKADMVDISGIPPTPEEGSAETDTAIEILGGPFLVTSLGDNFKAYIRAWRAATIDAGSPINIYINPQVLRVQEVQSANVDSNSSTSYKISEKPPASDTYPDGSSQNNYYVKYVFKTPLTFTIIESGVTKYITFRTVMDQE